MDDSDTGNERSSKSESETEDHPNKEDKDSFSLFSHGLEKIAFALAQNTKIL